MSYPPNGLDQKLISNSQDLVFVANFLMEKSLQQSVILASVKQIIKLLPERIKSIAKGTAAVLIQPTDSLDTLRQVLEVIVDNKIKHVGITNFEPLLTNPRQAMEFLGTIRSVLPFDTILYLLSPVPHNYFTILTYAGIDVFNTGFATIATKQSLYLTDFGGKALKDIKEQFCFCEACNKLVIAAIAKKEKLTKEEKELLEKHNTWVMSKKLLEIRHALKAGELRSFVEQTLYSNAFSAASLRLLDEHWSEYLVARTPTWQATSIYHITSYSYYRPDIKEFQRRIRERYQISDHKKIIVILPCSARKPYSGSKSHKTFLSILDSIANKKRGYIQELVLTSPLGVIPRELEQVYPAAHYDIPVTGHWEKKKKNMAIDQLVSVLEKVKDKQVTVIAHVSNEYIELCEKSEEQLGMKFIYTARKEKATAANSLDQLRVELNKVCEPLQPVPFYKDVEFLQTLADYQFGKSLGKKLFPGKLRVKKRPHYNPVVFMHGKQAGVIQEKTGQLTLSLDTGDILAENASYYIVLDGLELKGSTLFAVGVKEADPQIRPTDAVVILNNERKVVAIGRAIASGKDMVKMTTGQVAKVTKKVKN